MFFYASELSPASEFRAGDGGGNGYVQALCRVALAEAGNEELTVHPPTDGLGDAVSLVAHHDDALLGEWLLIDILAVKERAIDGIIGRQRRKQLVKVAIKNMYARNAPHRGLDGLGVIGIGRIVAAIDGVDAKPVGNADDGSQVAGILHPVEREREGGGWKVEGGRWKVEGGDGEEGQHLLGMLEETDALELFFRDKCQAGEGDVCRRCPGFRGEDGLGRISAKEVANDFRTFCDKKAFTFPIFLQFQLSDVLYLVFANHFFPFCLQRYVKNTIYDLRFTIFLYLCN